MKIAAGTIIKDCKKIIESSKRERDADSDDDADAISVSSRNNESEHDDYESDGEPVVRNPTIIKKSSRSLARAFINDEAEESEREDEEEEEEDVEELTEAPKTRAPKKKDKTGEDKDSVLEDLEEHDGGFIPIMKKNTEDVSGAITSRQVLITGCFR
jgi:hypothetical protein